MTEQGTWFAWYPVRAENTFCGWAWLRRVRYRRVATGDGWVYFYFR